MYIYILIQTRYAGKKTVTWPLQHIFIFMLASNNKFYFEFSRVPHFVLLLSRLISCCPKCVLALVMAWWFEIEEDTSALSLPSATKLRRLCFHRRVSVHEGGGCLVRGRSAPRGVPGPGRGSAVGGAWSQGVPGLGGLVPQGAWSRGGAWSGGWVVAWSRGAPGPGGGYPSKYWDRPPPRERRLLLQTVRILLECILLSYQF